MTKKKGIASKLFLVLVALTLLSCCFLGTTFARYTSGGTGSATTGVALWKIDVTDGIATGEHTVDFGKLSPSYEAWSSFSDKRTNETGAVLLATIVNSGEVSADVTIDVGKAVISGTASYGSGITEENASTGTAAASEAQVKNLFSIAITVMDAVGSPVEANEGVYTLAPGATLSIRGNVTWTSTDDWGQQVSDAIDTWVGQNMTSVSYSVSYTAVQASEQSAA